MQTIVMNISLACLLWRDPVFAPLFAGITGHAPNPSDIYLGARSLTLVQKALFPLRVLVYI